MTNLEKMNELVGSNATKEQVLEWAYMNRIIVEQLPEEQEFEVMNKSVENFCNSDFYKENLGNEYKIWDKFLDSEFVCC